MYIPWPRPPRPLLETHTSFSGHSSSSLRGFISNIIGLTFCTQVLQSKVQSHMSYNCLSLRTSLWLGKVQAQLAFQVKATWFARMNVDILSLWTLGLISFVFIQSMKGRRALSPRWCRHIAGVFKRDLGSYFKSCACCTSFKGQLSGKQKKIKRNSFFNHSIG